ncbi:MAG: autotransporter-associated beta strand repeat-containing protein [Methyloceanibacter sp.]|uniref:autotransporter-associated beta strand repeat-containing protein n=1 Tax=Methyloceanibacter sp. TaxID=1965321 RepID=UPI003D6CC41D
MIFNSTSTAGQADILNDGLVQFNNSSTAGSALIQTGDGALVQFLGTSNGGNATFVNTGTGTVDFSGTTGTNNDNQITAGSIDGGGSFVLGANTLTVADGDGFTVSGVISGVGGSLALTSGTLTLSAANTYSGTTTVDGGTLELGDGGSIMTDVTVNTGAVFAFNKTALGDSPFGFDGIITGAGGVTKLGDGVVNLTAVNTYEGSTTISDGTLALGATGSIEDSSVVNVAGGATFDISATTGASIVDLEGNGTVELGDETLTLTDALAATIFSGVIQGTGGLTLIGDSSETLTGANTYTGATTLNAGTQLFLNAGGSIAASEVVTVDGTLNILAHTGGASITSLAGAATGSVVLGVNTLTLTAADDTFAGVISSIGGGLTVEGGTQTLSGVNTYSGATAIDALGSLFLSGSGSISQSSVVTVDGLFDIDGTTSGASITSLAGAGEVNLGNETLDITAAADTFSGAIMGTGGSVAITGGTQTFSGINTYTGTTTISGDATLSIGADTNVGVGAVIFNDGTLDLTAAFTLDNAVTLGAGGGTIDTSVAGDDTFSGVISGAGPLTKTGPATLTLTGINSYTGATNIDETTLALMGTGSIAQSSVVDIALDATFDISGLAPGDGTSIRDLQGSGNVDLGDKTLALTAATAAAFSGVIDGTGGIDLLGGTETFTGINTYDGATFIDEGATLGLTSTGSIAQSSTVTADGTFNISGVDDPGTDIVSLDGGGSVVLGIKTLTLTNANGAFGGVIGGTGGLTLDGGTEILTGANTYTGLTTINDGILQIGNGGAIGSITDDGGVLIGVNGELEFNRSNNLTYGGVIDGGGTLTKEGAGNLTLTGANTYTGGTNVAAGTLTGTTNSLQGDILNNAALVFSQAFAGDYDGVIDGTGTVTKNGVGILTLTGVNDYTGNTTINNGTLLVEGSIADSAVTFVTNNATLGGSGTVGDVLVQNGGTLAPGASTAILSTDSVTFQSSAAMFSVELNGTTAGTDYDQLHVSATGEVNLSNATLEGTLGFALTGAASFVIIDNDGVDPIVGTFAQGGAILIGNRFFTIDYTGGDGNDVELFTAGAIIAGNSAANIINGSSSVGSQPFATNFRDIISGNGGNDTIFGLGGNDTLNGNNGDDTLRGGDGNDVLTGGRGKDIQFGDAGRDFFDFNSIKDSVVGGKRDKLMDFSRGQDDMIDLRGIPGKFKFIGKDDFSDTKGELRYEDKGSKVIVQGDTNGDGKADFEIFVNIGSLVKSDFFL